MLQINNKERSLKRGIVFLLFGIFLISFISAEDFDRGYEIKYPVITTLKQNTDFTFNFHVFNITNGVPIDNSSTSCDMHLYNSLGEQIYEEEVPHSIASVINEWEIALAGGNFSNVGYYAYIIQCNSSLLGGFESVEIEITPSGLEAKVPESILYSLVSIILFGMIIILGYFAIVLPSGNARDEEGEIMGIVKLKYLKLLCVGALYPLILIMLNLLVGLTTNFTTLSIFPNIVGFLFEIMLRSAWIFTLILVIWMIYMLIKDSNFRKVENLMGGGK